MDCGYWGEEAWSDTPEPDAERVDYEGDHEDDVLRWFPGACFECGEVGHRGCDCPRRAARKGKGFKDNGKKGDDYKGHKG